MEGKGRENSHGRMLDFLPMVHEDGKMKEMSTVKPNLRVHWDRRKRIMALGDATNWDEQAYRAHLRAHLLASSRTVFAARFSPSPDILATASSDGSVSLYSISARVPAQQQLNLDDSKLQQVAEPFISLTSHQGPAYDLQFYGAGEDALLLSCGDDGNIQGWHWQDVGSGLAHKSNDGKPWQPALVLRNPQLKGPRGALAPMPETNALATNSQEGCIFSAAGNGLAYCWDLESQKISMVFEGHLDYLHCVCSRPSHKQIITGSEDGTTRIWDCRSAHCIAILDPWKGSKISKIPKQKPPWVSCVALDSSEKWLVCGTGGCSVTLWSLPGLDAVTRIGTLSAPQAITIANDQIMTVGAQPHLSCFNYGGNIISQVAVAPLSAFSVSAHPSGVIAVAGYGALVDIISEFGSHICTFRCK